MKKEKKNRINSKHAEIGEIINKKTKSNQKLILNKNLI